MYADLPATEPTTLDAVKHAMGIAVDDTDDDDDLASAVIAASALVRSLPVAGRADGEAEWPTDLQRGATLLAAALVPKRKTPAGGRVFTVDSPEVQMLLETGAYSRPAVG